MAAAAIAAAAMFANPAHAVTDSSPHPGADYVALGSSYAAGGGLGPADPADGGGRCGQTTIAYPYLVAEALDLQLTDAACGGATVDNVATTPQLVQSRDGSAQLRPLQLEAVGEETNLVTITIGGNDVSYVGNLTAEACLGDLAANPASIISNLLKQYGLCNPLPDSAVQSRLTGLQDSLTSMVQAVRERAPRARIVLVDYLTVLPQDGKPCATMPIPQDRQKFLLYVAGELSLATKHTAQHTGADFVAASTASRGHDVCSADPWVTGYDFSHGFVIMHPNAEGHAAVADAVIRNLTGVDAGP